MISSPYILLSRISPNEPVSAKGAVAAIAGKPMQIDSAGGASLHLHDDNTTFRQANVTLGKIYFLAREVIDATEQPLENLEFGNSDVNPALINDPVSAFEAFEIEAEGGGDADGTGQLQVETATLVGTVTEPGDIIVTVTGALVVGSPLDVPVTIADNDTASVQGGKVRDALGLVAAITDFYTVGGSGATYSLTPITKAANDYTLNLAHDVDDAVGLTAAPTSANTTFGIQADAAGATFLKVSGTGAITPSTAADTALTIVSGEWAVLTDVATQPRCGKLIKQLTPHLPGNVRVGIEVCEPVFDKIV
jgi:hypothetical protein